MIEFHRTCPPVAFGTVFVKVSQRFFWRTKPREKTAACQKDHFVSKHHVFSSMCDHHDRAPLIGKLPHQTHQLSFHAGVQTRGGLIEKEKRRLGKKFDTNGDALLLTTAQLTDLRISAMRQVKIFHHFINTLDAFRFGSIGWHAQLSGIVQGLKNRQLHMDDIFLRNIPNGGPNRVKLLVDIDRLVDNNPAVSGWSIARNRIHKR